MVARDDAFNSGTLDVTVTVTDQNEGPEIIGAAVSLSFTENQTTEGRVLATYTAARGDRPRERYGHHLHLQDPEDRRGSRRGLFDHALEL